MINVILAAIATVLYILMDIFIGDTKTLMFSIPIFFSVLIVAINERSDQ